MNALRQRFGYAAAAIAAIMVAAGCSSSGSNAASQGGSSPSASANANPITVMGIGPYSGSSQYNYPDEQKALQVFFDQVNASGGANGHHVNVVFCSDKTDPNTARSCALSAVQKHVDAAILSSNYTSNIDPVLQQNKIPFLVQSITSNDDGTDSYAFPIDAGTPGTSAAIGATLAQAGCKHVGSIYVNGVPLVASILDAANASLGSHGTSGIESGLKIGITPTEVSLQSQVAQLISKKADCLLPVMTPAEGVLLERAIASSSDPSIKVAAFCSVFPPSLLLQLKSAASNLLLACGGHLPTDTDVPGVQTVVNALKGTPNLSNFALANWAMADIVNGAAKTITGPITPASLYTALSSMSSYDTQGLLPPWTTTGTPKPVGTYTRVFNPVQNVWTVQPSGVPQFKASVNTAEG